MTEEAKRDLPQDPQLITTNLLVCVFGGNRKKFSDLKKIDTFAFINVFFVALTLKQIEKISKALGDASRLKILHHISNKGGSGQCSEIQHVLDLAQPSISHHVKILVEAGLIEPEKEGRNHKYTLNNEVLNEYRNYLGKLIA